MITSFVHLDLRVLQSREIKNPSLSCCWRRKMQARQLVSCATWSEQMPKSHWNYLSLLQEFWKPKKIRRPDDLCVHILKLLDFASEPIFFLNWDSTCSKGLIILQLDEASYLCIIVNYQLALWEHTRDSCILPDVPYPEVTNLCRCQYWCFVSPPIFINAS